VTTVLRSAASPVYNRLFWLTYAANTVLVLANALTFRFAEFVTFLGGSEQLTGTVISVGVLCAVAVRFRLGHDIDACGTRRLWLTSTLLFAAACGLLMLTHSISWVLYVARIAFSIGIAGMFTCSMVNIQNEVPAERRTEAIGSLGTSGFLGMILGSLLGDIAFAALPDGGARFTLVFSVALVLGGVYLALVMVITRNHRRPQPGRINPPVYRLIRRYWPGSVMLVALLMGAGLVVTTVFLTRMATERGIANIGTFFVAYSLSALACRVFTRNWSRTVGRRRMIAVGLCGHVVGQLLLMAVHSPWQLAVPALFCGLGHGLLFPAVTSLGSGTFPDRFRGTGTTIALGMCELGVAISSPLFGWIIDSWGFNAMYAVSVALSVTLGTVYLVRSRHFVDDEQIQATTTDDNSLPVPTLSVSLSTTRDPDGDDELKSPVVVPRKSVDVSA
jgi:MFS family permease